MATWMSRVVVAALKEGGRLCHGYGGSIREAGGSMGKRAVAKEEQYFWEQERRQIVQLREELRKGRLDSKLQCKDQLEEMVTRQKEQIAEHQRRAQYHKEEMEMHRKEYEHHLERIVYHNDKEQKLREKMSKLRDDEED
ncbi:ATPase inhibitor, mitochondrial-like isoform X1 [Scylla paramamosain]|uniref:ATPase inhibitor, mitochondrial-like isoform X1 n=1 Tax=Scylla paramamosain TaxID=85552 RepID=UPI0030837086